MSVRADAAGRDEASSRPLRVGIVVGNFPVISETFVINQAAGLLSAGHDVRILAMDGQRPADRETHDTVDRWSLNERAFRPLAGRMLIAPFQRPSEVGGTWPLRRRALTFAAQGGMFARQPKFDIVHCQFASLGLEVERHMRLGLLRARRLVVHLRGSDVSRFVQEKGQEVYRGLFARADLLIANCDYFRRRAIDLGAPPHRVIVIGSAIEGDRFQAKTDYSTDGLRVLSIGRLVEKKGFEYAIRGVAMAARSGLDVSYEIIGDGVLRPALERLVAELGMEHRIRLPGALPHQEVVRHLGAADILLAPSVRAADGDEDAPVNALKEGMATGLPALATRHGGIPELVEDEVNGLLVEERDAAGIADALGRLSSMRDRWPAMAAAGRAKTLAMYDQKVVNDRLIGAYRSLFEPLENAR